MGRTLSNSDELYSSWITKVLHVEELEDDEQEFYVNVLCSIPYRALMEMDKNRLDDGLHFRHYVNDLNNWPSIFDDELEVSVCEVLAGLALRASMEVIDIPVGDMFWDWVHNLCPGLPMDEDFIQRRVDEWLNRHFKPDGTGSPFPILHSANVDQREVELWSQMCGYLVSAYVEE